MPCGCQNTCGCTIVGDGVTATAVTVGDTTTISSIPPITSVADTNCVDLNLAAGVLTAAPIIAPATTAVPLTCTPTGLKADILIDPSGTAPVTKSAAGLKINCCAGATVPLAGSPAVHADTCENRLRYNNLGELTLIPDGLQVVSVIDGNIVAPATTAATASGNSLSTTFTNNRNCVVYAMFVGHVSVIATPLVTNPAAAGRILSIQGRADSGGGTTGVVLGGIGAWSQTDFNNTQLTALTVLTRMRGTVQILFELDPGEAANAIVYTQTLEALTGYQTTVALGTSIQSVGNKWLVWTQRQS
jgi:hypothetical protein